MPKKLKFFKIFLFVIIFTMIGQTFQYAYSQTEINLQYFPITEDSYVVNNIRAEDEAEKTNVGKQDFLKVWYLNNDDIHLESTAFLKFDVLKLSKKNTNIELQLLPNTITENNVEINLFFIDDNSWTEQEITYSNSPKINSEPIATKIINNPDEWIIFDITDLIKEKKTPTMSFAIKIKTDESIEKLLTFHSKESSYPPRLVANFSEPLKSDGNYLVGDYNIVEGYGEIIIRNSEDHLVGYKKVSKLNIFEHPFVQGEIDSWDVVGTIERDGIEYDMIQRQNELFFEIDIGPGITGMTIGYFEKPVFFIYFSHEQYLLEPGDWITIYYTIFVKK